MRREGKGRKGRGRQGRENRGKGRERRDPQYFIAPQIQFSRNMPAAGVSAIEK